MAILTLQSKAPGMDFRFSMAAGALTRCPFKNLVLVAARTIDRGVHPFQRKNLGMLETAEPVESIVAIQTGRTIALDMIRHKFRSAASGWIISR